jgi:hypothetical protein
MRRLHRSVERLTGWWCWGPPDGPSEKIKAPILFIVTRDDRSGDGPKEWVVLEGSAHAHIFQTEQSERVMREILRFISGK